MTTDGHTLNIPIPTGVDPTDYAAFQEAYRRGAQAAAALAQPSHPRHAAAQQALFAAGFAAAQQQHQNQQIGTPTGFDNSGVNQNVQPMMGVNMQQQSNQNQPQPQQQVQQQVQQQQQPQQQHQQQVSSGPKHLHTSLMAATAASLQPPTTQQTKPAHQQQSTMIRPNTNIAPHHTNPQQQQQQQPSMMGISGPSSNTGASSNITAPPTSFPMNFSMNNDVQGHLGAPVVGGGTGMNASASRSISLPDMARYAARANAEDNKRKKRLARNRASARLRRLKKKNLVSIKNIIYFSLHYMINSCTFLFTANT